MSGALLLFETFMDGASFRPWVDVSFRADCALVSEQEFNGENGDKGGAVSTHGPTGPGHRVRLLVP